MKRSCQKSKNRAAKQPQREIQRIGAPGARLARYEDMVALNRNRMIGRSKRGPVRLVHCAEVD